jgi:hypothetical protein
VAEERNIRSARVPLPWFGLASPGLAIGAELPGDGNDASHDNAGDDGVGLPVRGLSVPATSGRPDVLGVPVDVIRTVLENRYDSMGGERRKPPEVDGDKSRCVW